MARQVNTTPPLPYPGGNATTFSLSAFDQDLVRSLTAYLSELARRANETLPTDGTEPMEGNLDMGGNNIINAATITSTALRVEDDVPFLTLKDTNNTGNGVVGGVEVVDSANTRKVFMGEGSASDQDLYLVADAGEIQLFANGGNGAVYLGTGRLRFPTTPNSSADPNTLDEYEEGTWTPTWVPSAGAFGAHTYTSRAGTYTKVGRLVTIGYQIHLSAYVVGTASGTVTIQGLPFSQPAASLIGAPFWANSFATQQPWPVTLLSNGAINVYNGASAAAGPTAAYPVANFSNTAQIYGSGVYPGP